MHRFIAGVRRYFQGWSTVDPAVAMGLFGTGVGMAIPDYPVRPFATTEGVAA